MISLAFHSRARARVSRALVAIGLSCSFALLPASARAQLSAGTGVVAGRIVGPGGEPAADAVVALVNLRRQSRVADDGSFRFDGVPVGVHVVQAESVKFGTAAAELRVEAGQEARLDLAVDIAVHHEEILVSAGPEARLAEGVAQPAAVLDLQALQLKMKPTLGETLAAEPGMSSTSFGQGASRPVIRGFAGDRIRILDNGVGSGDVSDTSPDHAISSDPFSAESIEVLRGPATLLYGSSALGGVVNVISDSIPSRVPDDGLGGRLDLRASSNAEQQAGSAGLTGGTGRFAWHLDGFRREADDYESAESTVVNSDLEADGGRAGVSLVGDRGFLGVAASRFSTNYGNPAEEVVRIDLDQTRYDLRGEWNLDDGVFRTLRVRLGGNDYEHTEFEGDEVGTVFLDDGWEGRVEAAHRPFGPVSGSWGVQYKRRDFEAIGAEAFVRASSTDSWSAFLLEELGSGPLRWQVGLRYDSQDVQVDAAELPDRSFGAVSASTGLVWSDHGWVAAGTLSRSVKLPNAVELYAFGPHIATLAFEIGDPNLGREVALGGEVSLRRTEGRVRGELSLFTNRIDGYIFEQFTGEPVPEEGGEGDEGEEEEEAELRVVRFVQRDAEFRGAEGHLDVELIHADPHHLALELGADYVRAELRDTGEGLPRIPPLRFSAGLRYSSARWGAGVVVRRVDGQERVAELETETAGYTWVDADVSCRLFSGRLVHDFVLRAANLTDELALNHVSYLKEVAPLPGRDVSLAYRVSF